jgi:hypothetical protein
MQFGCNAQIKFLAKAESGSVSIYLMILQNDGSENEDKAVGFTISSEKARMMAAAISKACDKALIDMPAFPV